MEFFSVEWFATLLSIVLIDLVLAGDNAIVIGMAARNIPADNRKKVIVLGTVGAVVIRALMTLAVVWLLKIPGLLIVGGILLLWIAYKLLVEDKGHAIESKNSMLAAIRTIIVADAVMGMDNVLAVAGAAHGSFVLVVIGLFISIPIVVWGSTLFVKLVHNYPWIIYAGAGILAITAMKMLWGEPIVKEFIHFPVWGKWAVNLVVTALILYIGLRKKRASHQTTPVHAKKAAVLEN